VFCGECCGECCGGFWDGFCGECCGLFFFPNAVSPFAEFWPGVEKL